MLELFNRIQKKFKARKSPWKLTTKTVVHSKLLQIGLDHFFEQTWLFFLIRWKIQTTFFLHYCHSISLTLNYQPTWKTGSVVRQFLIFFQEQRIGTQIAFKWFRQHKFLLTNWIRIGLNLNLNTKDQSTIVGKKQSIALFFVTLDVTILPYTTFTIKKKFAKVATAISLHFNLHNHSVNDMKS